MSPSAVLQNYCMMEEALVVWSLLRDAGFDASIDNYNHVSNEWYLVPAFGGIPVRVPFSQYEAARAFLSECATHSTAHLEEATGETPIPIVRSGYWRAWVGLGFFFGLIELVGLPILIFLQWILPEHWFTITDFGSGEPVLRLGPAIGEGYNFNKVGGAVLLLLTLLLMTWNDMFDAHLARDKQNQNNEDIT